MQRQPAIIPFDADVLFQLFLGCPQLGPLRHLHNEFGVQPVLVQEVEMELRQHRLLGPRCEPILDKALGHQTLEVVDSGVVSKVLGSPASNVTLAMLEKFNGLGGRLRKHVGAGEAHTHAFGVTFDVPVFSNDARCLRTLAANSLPAAAPVLRFFDLVVLCRQDGHLDEKECEQIRKTLRSEGEGLHSAFEHNSFKDGLNRFVPRLIANDKPLLGDSGPLSPSPDEVRLFLKRKTL